MRERIIAALEGHHLSMHPRDEVGSERAGFHCLCSEWMAGTTDPIGAYDRFKEHLADVLVPLFDAAPTPQPLVVERPEYDYGPKRGELAALAAPTSSGDNERRMFAASAVRDVLDDTTDLNTGDRNRVAWRIVDEILPRTGTPATERE